MSFSFFDFLVDLMWGTSEIYLARRKKRKLEKCEEIGDQTGRQNCDQTTKEVHEATQLKFANRDEASRIIGNKTV